MIENTKICKCCGETKPLAVFYVGRGKCKTCGNAESKTYYEKNRRSVRESQKAWREQNKDKALAQKAEYYLSNRKCLIEKSRRYYAENKEARAGYSLQWQRANKQKLTGYAAKRRAMRLNAVVAWSDGFIVSEMYDLARRRTLTTGIEWHVDHIVPLQSAKVCGLHAHTNLRVIPGLENKVKSNSVWPGMPR